MVRQRYYVGNLPFDMCVRTPTSATSSAPTARFSKHTSCATKKRSDPKGFCFVEIETENPQKVVDDLDGIEVGGRKLRVSFADPRPEKRRNETRR